MALVNIIAKASIDFDWERLYSNIVGINKDGIEVFPIPKEIGFEHDAIGIVVTSNYDNKCDLLERLLELCRLMLLEKFQLFELYDGEEITENNLIYVFNSLITC